MNKKKDGTRRRLDRHVNWQRAIVAVAHYLRRYRHVNWQRAIVAVAHYLRRYDA